MKKIILSTLCALLLAGCATNPAHDSTQPQPTEPSYAPLISPDSAEIPYTSRFASETAIVLSDDGITVNSGSETDSVFTSHDIIYYEDRASYESGNPYGEGELTERHSEAEAKAHTVVNITSPGTYRVSGKLSQGQIRVDLGEDASEDPTAVVELILDGADITCTVAPAVLFLNTYECDGNWTVDTAKAEVDTTSAGANLILAENSRNTVTGSHVAKIFKDQDEEKKLWKQDGAIYSYMSLNVFGPGALDLTADNEGLDSELHLTINGGKIAIRSDNDGINTNEDGVSVTTINGGDLHIIAGLGAEGDGIDSNGYLVINGGNVVSSANPAADAGLDSDLGSFIHGGTVIALGSTMDWTETDSNQVTMNLQFADYQSSGSAVVVTQTDGTVIFAYDPSEDEVLEENVRRYMGAVISCPNFHQGESYHVYLDGTVTGADLGGIYDVTTISAYENGIQQMYTGTDVTMRPGGFGGGQRPDSGEPPQSPDGESRPERPEDWNPGDTPPEGFEDHRPPEDERPSMPEGETLPEGWTPYDGRRPSGQSPAPGEGNTLFYMQDKVNFFSGLTAAQ